jgi:hypothetical protein
VTIELAPGRATLHDVGALGTRFSALAFARDGRLFGVTGDGTVPGETLFEIDPRSAAVTSLRMLGAGGDGEALAYDAGNNRLLHWSGDDLHVVEAISLAPPYATTELAMDMPAPARETSAAVALGGGSFLTATMTRRLVRWRGDGTAEVLPGETNVGHRGLARIAVAPGDFALEPATTSTRGGALVTVRGWFVPSDVVGLAVDGVAVPLASASATALTFVAPPHGAGDAPIVVTTTVAGPLDGGTLTYAD